MKTIQIEDWRTYRRDGEQFLNTALAAPYLENPSLQVNG